MHIRIFNPWEFRKEKKEVTFKIQGSMNCQYKTDDVVASSNSDVTRKAVCEPDEGINRLVARKRFLPTKHSLSSLINNYRKGWTACKGLISLIIIRLAMILRVLGKLTKIIRCERKSIVGNSMEFSSNEKLRNVGAPFPFTIFHKCLNTIMGFQRKLWHCDTIYLLWERNKIDTRGTKKLWSFSSRPILAKTGLRNLQLGNTVNEMFSRRSGNTVETFLAGQYYGTYVHLFADLCAFYALLSCTNMRWILNLMIGSRLFIIIYFYIYMIYISVCHPVTGHRTLGLSQLKRILWFIFHQKQVF